VILIAMVDDAKVFDIEDDDPMLGKRVILERGGVQSAPLLLENVVTKMSMSNWRWVNPPTK
jgi:hypothetical protein